MTDSPPYMPKNRQHPSMVVFLKGIVCLLLTMSLPFPGHAAEDPLVPYEEILVFMNVQGVGGIQIPAAIRKEQAWLSITDVFDYLKIRNTPTPKFDSVAGFFINRQSPYLIDQRHNRILYHGKTIELPKDALFSTTTALYLRCDYFGQVFGLECKFNFRSLSVILKTSLDLPVIREIRQESMRNNIGRLKGEIKVDTNLRASHPFARFGMADWAVVATQNTGQISSAQGIPVVNGQQNDLRLNLGLGGVLAGGATNISLNYDNNIPFAEREQYYQWRYVDNDRSALRQVTAGKIFTPSISSIYSPVVGIQFTNAPTTYRRSFGTYTLTYYTEADWVVELYVNNELVNYAKSDVSGLFTFQVPLVYGNSLVKLRFYSPWGEERSSEQNIQIPFTFLPLHEFEYTATAGMVEDSLNSRFTRANFNYGLTGRLTAGGGIEYLSSVTTGKSIPFVNASFRLSSRLLLAEEYAVGVRSKFIASYHLPSDLQIEIDYIRYKKGQTAINNNFLEERRAILSFPFRMKKFTIFSRLSLYQIVLPSSPGYTTAEGLISGVFLGVSTNFTTYALFNAPFNPYVYSSFSMAFRLPGKIIFTPQLQYEYDMHKLIDMRTEFGKYVNSRGYANIYYEKNVKSQFHSIGIGFRYDFSFALTGTSFTGGNHTSALVQSASGGLLYDDRTNYLGVSNRSNLDKGGLIVLPFLDLNGNGRRDQGEPKVYGLKIRINGGRIQNNKADTTIRVSDLEAYAKYILNLDPSFENISWHLRYKTIGITIDPNQFKIVEVPVIVEGEVAGTVYLKTNDGQKAQERIVVCLYRNGSVPSGQTITESDGSFDFVGLSPGAYTAQVSPSQLQKLNMTAAPAVLSFTISNNKEGDLIKGLTFILEPAAGKIQKGAPGTNNQ